MMILKKKAMLAFLMSACIGMALASAHSLKSNKSKIEPDSHLVEIAFQIILGKESNNQQFGGPGSTAGPGEPTTSSAGAIGIAQLMPKTARYVAEKAGIQWDKDRYRYDTEYNRRLGKTYFKWQLRDFGSDLEKAFAAYNAGPTRTRKTVKKHGAKWLEHMPKETRDYVHKNMKRFAAAMTKKPFGIEFSLN